MIAAVIALASLSVLLGSGLIAAVVLVRSSLANERASMTVVGVSGRAQLQAERDRDVAIAARTQAELERDQAQAQLVSFQALFKSASAEEVRRVHDQILSGSATDAVDALNALLSVDLSKPGRPADGDDATGDDHGVAEPAAVRPP